MTDTKDLYSKMLDSASGDESVIEIENQVLAPLLDEISLIKDWNIASFVRSILLRAGPFWSIPSNFYESMQNPLDEYGEGGNVLHTKRVVRATALLSEAYELSDKDRDIVLAAAILHDVTKASKPSLSDSTVYFDVMHPYTVDKFVRWIHREDQTYAGDHQSSTLFIDEEVGEKILRAIRCHMGAWSPIPETKPTKKRDMVVHVANLVAKSLPYIIDGDDIQEWRWLNHSSDPKQDGEQE